MFIFVYFINWNHEFLFYNIESMIHAQLTTTFKVKHGYILIVYYKSHGVGIWVI